MNKLIKKPLNDLIEYLKSSIDVIISLKLNEELEKYKFDNDAPGAVKDYEILLQKLEQNIREHISIEHQLKIQCEKYVEKLEILEDEKIILLSQIVSQIIFIFIQDDERKEFNEQLEELTEQIDKFLKQKNDFELKEKSYKTEIEKKNKEIIQLQAKIEFLNKNIKDLETKITNNNTININNNITNNNIIDDKSKTNTIINNNQEDISDYKKLNCTLTQQNLKKINIRNIKNYYNRNNSSININNNNINNFNNITNNKSKNIFFSKNLENQKKLNTKKLLLRNMSSSNIDTGNIDNYNKKILGSNCNNKNSSINESIGNYLCKINESEFNNISRDYSNNRNNSKNNNPIGKLKLKLPVNITNNNYNMNKNNVMINLSTNIVSNNINIEKLKVQQKLVEYRKLIDKKINELTKNKKRNINQNKKKTQTQDKDRISRISRKSPKNFEIYKKASISCLNSEIERKVKKKFNNISNISNISNTSHKNINNEQFKNIHDKNIILPKKINGNDFKFQMNNNSQKNIKMKQNNRNKINIVSKNIDEKSKFNINNFDEDEKDNNIHEQITSKGNEEEKSEDSKK